MYCSIRRREKQEVTHKQTKSDTYYTSEPQSCLYMNSVFFVSAKICSVIRYVCVFLIICIHIYYFSSVVAQCIMKKTWLWVVTRATFPLITAFAWIYMHTNGLFEEWMKGSSFEKLQQNHLFPPKQHSLYDKRCFTLMNNSQILSNQVLKIS